jgi:ferritin-like metal-binding protein YciE
MSGDTGLTCVASNTGIRATVRWNVASGELRHATCHAIMGIVEEGEEIAKEYKGSPALDAGLLAAAQAVEHYEISRYGTLRTWAEELGLPDAVKLLEATLREEKATDVALSQIAETVVNQEAEAA